MSTDELNNRIKSFLSSALHHLAHSKYDKAIEELQAAEVLDKDNPEILYNLGIAYSKDGLHATAINYFKRIIDLPLTFVDIITVKKLLAYSLLAGKQFDEALYYLYEITKTIEYDTIVLNMLGFCYEKKNNIEEALKVYHKVITFDKKNINAYNSLAFLMAKSQKDINAALNFARVAYKHNPENPAYLDTIGYIYMKKGDIDLAKKFLKKALEKAPASDEIRNHLHELLQL
jgi:tetratricopeptide (TPR) repeat protein